jgi:hypothetical protein
VLLEARAHRIGVVVDAEGVAIVLEVPTSHGTGHPELVESQPQ